MGIYTKNVRTEEQYRMAAEYLSQIRRGEPTTANMIWNYMFDHGFQNWGSSSISLKMNRLISMDPHVTRISPGTYVYMPAEVKEDS